MVYQYNQTVNKQKTNLLLPIIVAALLIISLATGMVNAKNGNGNSNKNVTTIQSGELENSDGETLKVGFDQWGYNYQAHMFSGDYCGASRVESCAYEGTKLSMKWNDAWLSNVDADGDGLLDRHNGHVSYVGSGAWITNHMSGEYELDDKTVNWTYFVKIVAVPEGSYLENGVYYLEDETELGPMIWSQFAVVQEVYNDPGQNVNGLQMLSATGAGLGNR